MPKGAAVGAKHAADIVLADAIDNFNAEAGVYLVLPGRTKHDADVVKDVVDDVAVGAQHVGDAIRGLLARTPHQERGMMRTSCSQVPSKTLMSKLGTSLASPGTRHDADVVRGSVVDDVARRRRTW